MASENQNDPNFDGTEFTLKAAADARKSVDSKVDEDRTTPVMSAASPEVSTEEPAEKTIEEYEPHADNDGKFRLKEQDDGTNVEAGQLMENLTRAPAHQHHELAVEEDAPGFEQAAALMTPRGNPHYDEGGSINEVKAGRSFGEA